MLLAIALITYALIGTVIGRILFRLRLGASARYTVDRNYDSYDRGRKLEVIDTHDKSSAQTYGLWSIFLWPITLAFFLVQAPTPKEKMAKRTQEFKDATAALEAVAKEYDLKVSL